MAEEVEIAKSFIGLGAMQEDQTVALGRSKTIKC
jgi:hypothetical protein